MIKKFFIGLTCALVVAQSASAATVNSILNNIDSTLYTIDRIQNTGDRVQRRMPRRQDSNVGTRQQNTYGSSNYGGYNYGASNGYQTPYPSQNFPVQNYPQYPTQAGQYSYPTPVYQPVGNTQNSYPQNTIQQGNVASPLTNYTGQAITLGDLPAGVFVLDKNSVWNYRQGDNYAGEINLQYPVIWRVIEHKHYADNTTLLMSESCVAMYPFCHSNKGVRDWAESDVRRFLKTTFATAFSAAFKNATVPVAVPYATLSGTGKTVTDTFFLPSIVEWGLSDRANNGKAYKYSDIYRLYEGTYTFTFENGKMNWNSRLGKAPVTRTINRPKAESAGYKWDVFVVKNGVLEDWWYYKNQCVRPVVNLKSTTKVKGPYQIPLVDYGNQPTNIVGNSFIYYELDLN